MNLELVLLLVVCLPVVVDGFISVHANTLRYRIGMKRLKDKEDEEGPVGFQ